MLPLLLATAHAWTPLCEIPRSASLAGATLSSGDDYVVVDGWHVLRPAEGCTYLTRAEDRVSETNSLPAGRISAGGDHHSLRLLTWRDDVWAAVYDFNLRTPDGQTSPFYVLRVADTIGVVGTVTPSRTTWTGWDLSTTPPTSLSTWSDPGIWTDAQWSPGRRAYVGISDQQTRTPIHRRLTPNGIVELPAPPAIDAYDGRRAIERRDDRKIEIHRFDGIRWIEDGARLSPSSGPGRVATALHSFVIRGNVLVGGLRDDGAPDGPRDALVLYQRTPTGWQFADAVPGLSVTDLVVVDGHVVVVDDVPWEEDYPPPSEFGRLRVYPLPVVDHDGDGVVATEDCDDANARVQTSSREVCDGIDNDCDGSTDDGCVDETGLESDTDVADTDAPADTDDDTPPPATSCGCHTTDPRALGLLAVALLRRRRRA